jgi:hypothetical protein
VDSNGLPRFPAASRFLLLRGLPVGFTVICHVPLGGGGRRGKTLDKWMVPGMDPMLLRDDQLLQQQLAAVARLEGGRRLVTFYVAYAEYLEYANQGNIHKMNELPFL